MQEKNDMKMLEINDWKLRVQEPEGEGPHPVMLLLHGWTGDENSMWIFSENLPANHLLIAPRAPHPLPQGGYSWFGTMSGDRPTVDDFIPAAAALIELLDSWSVSSGLDLSSVDLVGFSQGAAMSYIVSFLYPDRVKRVAGLSGFLPDGAGSYAGQRPLKAKPVFVTHGTRDKIIPVARARQSVQILEQAGANVTYCEHDVGHKLNADCFRALKEFYTQSQSAL